jgi:hypothetical protein
VSESEALFTQDENDALEALVAVAKAFHRICGQGNDFAEAVDKIHQLQAMVLSQIAARTYPTKVHTTDAHDCAICECYERFDARSGICEVPELWLDREGEQVWMHWMCRQSEMAS